MKKYQKNIYNMWMFLIPYFIWIIANSNKNMFVFIFLMVSVGIFCEIYSIKDKEDE